MKKILIIETDYEGHYLTGYIKFILRSFKHQRAKIILLTSISAKKNAKGAIKILRSEKVKFHIKIIPDFKITNFTSLSLIAKQIKYYFVIKKKFKELNFIYNFDHIFVTSIEKIDKAIVIFGSPFYNVPFSGIFLGVKFHLYKYGLHFRSRFNYLSKKFFQKLIKIPTLENIITNDHLLAKFVKSENFINYDNVKFLHDPKEFNFDFKKFYSRNKLGLPKKSIIILVYGALVETKGIFELLSIFKSRKLDSNVRIILAGKQFGKIKDFLTNDSFINKLKIKKKLFILDNWISEKKEAQLFAATDIVWIGYKNYSHPSGVLYQAVQKSIPSLISNDGIIYNLNKKIKVGFSLNINNSLNIIKAITYLMNSRNKKKYLRNILRFSKISNPTKWVLGFKQAHPKLFS
jgi:hypothetical protein